ncbi:hypothetical protein HMPREF0044_0249 [Gleimia coleocanis DSM 15436]|uniref:Uncharacterized protein n=1 Tax=Gleimia coleocanis DSM 15436 TaxID=525245 RepID=C0VYK9_9ACTO|nr:hypothetical protein HMPREF0044_0249 [Gleimia coleocanis DSM 15436]
MCVASANPDFLRANCDSDAEETREREFGRKCLNNNGGGSQLGTTTISFS